MVITVGGIKGGVGKTTIATNLAVWLSRKNADVLLVDADEQQSASHYMAYRDEVTGDKAGFSLVQLKGASVRNEVEKLRPRYDHIIIDTGGRDTTSQRAALFASDTYLLPFAPRGLDVWTMEQVLEMLGEIQITRATPLSVYSFLNRADVSGPENAEAREALKDNDELNFVDFPLGNRKVFGKSSTGGLSVFEWTPVDAKATDEADRLFSHIMKTKP